MTSRRLWRSMFVAVELVLLFAVPLLAWVGFRAVLDTTDGRAVDPQLDPDEPGYEAFLDPTPVQLVAGVDDAGALTWLTVLVLSGADDQGGAVLFVPVATLVDIEDIGDTTLRDAWPEDNGPALVAQAVSDLLTAGVGPAEVLDPERVQELFTPVMPLELTNGDDLEGFPAGDLRLRGSDVGDYLEARSDSESDLNRLVRHESVWRAWFAAIATSTDPNVVPGETDTGLGRFVRGIAAGPQTFDVVPGTPFIPPAPEATGSDTDDGATEPPTVAEAEVYAPDLDATSELVEDRIPLPVAPHPGARPRVRILDGVGADGLALRVARDVVRAGGQVVVIGNSDRFDATTSKVVYFDEPLGDSADEIALGVGNVEVQRETGPNPNDLVDITVVVGNDLAEAYGLSPRG